MRFCFIKFGFLFFLCSCFVSDGVDYSYSDVMNVIDKYSKSIAIKYKVIRRSHGLGYATRNHPYNGKIQVVDLGYSIDKSMNYEEARELFYIIVDGLLDEINKTEYLSKYFSRSPIGYEDLFFRLSFDYMDNGILNKDDVYQISIFENQIMYHFANGKKINMTQQPVSQDVYIFKGFSPEMRAIVRDLPEKDF